MSTSDSPENLRTRVVASAGSGDEQPARRSPLEDEGRVDGLRKPRDGRSSRGSVFLPTPHSALEPEADAPEDMVRVQSHLGLRLDPCDVEAEVGLDVSEAVFQECRNVLRDEERHAAPHVDADIDRRIGVTAEA